jgi:hypothetical protein
MKLKMEGILTNFADFHKIVKDKYFDTLWFVQFGKSKKEAKDGEDKEVKKETLQKRARPFVYRFMMHVEQKNLDFIPMSGMFFIVVRGGSFARWKLRVWGAQHVSM